jgi:hypothetical protein
MNKNFPVGSSVIATPKDNDFANEFTGTVISHNKGFIQVKDQEDNVFDCDPDQLTLEVKDTKGVVATVLDAIFGTKKQGCCGGKCGCHH